MGGLPLRASNEGPQAARCASKETRPICAALLPRLLNQFRHQSRPSSLMAGPDTGTVVPMEIFIEQDVIAPMRIVLQSIRSAEHRTFPLGILEEDVGQTT